MCNQMVTSEIREQFHTPSEIIPLFPENTIWLPINIMSDELC